MIPQVEDSAKNTDTNKTEGNTNEDKNVKEEQEIVKNVGDNEPKKEIVPEKTKPRKSSNIFKIILNSFKASMRNRKSKNEAEKLEKEKLKTIPKRVRRSQLKNKVSEEQEWFNKQYERSISVPKDTHEVNPSYVLRHFQMKTWARFVPEAQNMWLGTLLSKPVPKDSTFLSWKGPPIQHCLCPYRECFCRGNTLFDSKTIPWKWHCEFNPMYYFQSMCGCPKSKPNNYSKDFIELLKTKFITEEKRYQKFSDAGILSQLAPEVCLLRCAHFMGKGDKRTIKYIPIINDINRKFKDFKYNKNSESGDYEDDEDTNTEEEKKPSGAVLDQQKVDDKPICNTFSCTVSTQTDTGPDGKLNIGKVSHVIFASIKESVMRDIEGQKLYICPYEIECQKNNIEVYVQKMEKLFNIKQIRCRISKLISSIMEIKDPGLPVATRCTQLPYCNKPCDNFKNGSNNRNSCGLHIPCFTKNKESIIEEINKFNYIENKSSCVCCKTYLESFNNKIDSTFDEKSKDFLKNFVKQSSLEINQDLFPNEEIHEVDKDLKDIVNETEEIGTEKLNDNLNPGETIENNIQEHCNE